MAKEDDTNSEQNPNKSRGSGPGHGQQPGNPQDQLPSEHQDQDRGGNGPFEFQPEDAET